MENYAGPNASKEEVFDMKVILSGDKRTRLAFCLQGHSRPDRALIFLGTRDLPATALSSLHPRFHQGLPRPTIKKAGLQKQAKWRKRA